MNNPIISVIIPIYNVEKYLSEAIDSVLSQTLESSLIEVILVDDGSTDGSSDIAKKYADKNSNIIYIKVSNGGVSKARNTGLRKAHGTYIHFFDSDDLISKNFYEKSISFLDKNVDEVDFVASKIKFFDGIIDSHVLNNKFHTSRVIDLSIEPDNPILHAVSCVYRRDAIKGIFFDETLTISEDVKFLGDVLYRKKKYGVITQSTYFYRKRPDASSAIGGKEYNINYYISTPVNSYKYLLDKWSDDLSARKAIEYTILYDLSYRLTQKKQTVLNSAQENSYKQIIKSIAAGCHDETLINNSYLTVHQKIYILRFKYIEKFDEMISSENNVLYFNNFKLYSYNASTARVDFLTETNSGYCIEGTFDGPVSIASISLSVSGRELSIVDRHQRQEAFLGDVYFDGGAFQGLIENFDKKDIVIMLSSGTDTYPVSMNPGPHSRLSSLLFAYRRDKNYLIKNGKRTIAFHKYSLLRHLIYELGLLIGILIDWRISTARRQFQKLQTRNLEQLSIKAKIFEFFKPLLFVLEAIAMIPRAFILRVGYYVQKLFIKKPIWIISDRGMAAGDNGEALFRYVQQQKNDEIKVYFALSKQSKDYERLVKIGPVLNYGSLRYKQLFLLANKIISSHADIEVTNPFLRQIDHYTDLYTFDFIFLQHGIIRNDLSTWLNRFDKNIHLFITSAQKEYDSILKNPYYYDEKQVLLSGLPRYDYLDNKNANKIVIAPTYRNSLLRLRTDKLGARAYDDQFKKSDYFIFYNNLINDTRIIEAMNRKGVKGEVYIHPNFAPQLRDFQGNDTFKIQQYPYDYKKAISEGSLLVSDHSSIVFDFAYLKKPVIYAQFDEATFFTAQPYDKGDFFSDERDGFGPVILTYDKLVDTILQSINEDMRMSEEYMNRSEAFFAYHDKQNCERVFNAIMGITLG